MSRSLCIFLSLNREDMIFCEGGKSIAIDSKINYLTKINYRMHACSGRPKMMLDISELVELAEVNDFNDCQRHSRAWTSASRAVDMDLRPENIFPCVNEMV
jgi:hypothetical protein